MTILKDVLAELLGMFVADARLTTAICALVLITAGLIFGVHVAPLIGGAVLLLGCLAILVLSVRAEARRRGH